AAASPRRQAPQSARRDTPHRHQPAGGRRRHGQGSGSDRARGTSPLGGELREALGRPRRHDLCAAREPRCGAPAGDDSCRLAGARTRSGRASRRGHRRGLCHRLLRLGRSDAGAVAPLAAPLRREDHAELSRENVMSRCARRLLAPVVALLLIAGLFPVWGAFAQGPAPTGPITIGVLAPSTGPFATYARDIIDGARLYSDEVGGQLGRRKLELVVEDYQTKPDVALTKIRKLVERDQARAIVGLVLSAAALAVKDYVNAQKVPLLISGFAVAENL